MRFDLITIFPEFFAGPLDHGILRRARETGLVEVQVQDLRVFTQDRHRSVDDRPFGGGEGMVLKPEPLFEAAEAILGRNLGSAEQPSALAPKTAIVLMSAAGKLFRQETARRYAHIDRLVFLCGRYEGVDERVADHLATEEISVGDYVLSGGELPAMRHFAGRAEAAVSSTPTGDGSRIEARTLLDFPHYTRPADFRGWKVPEVLIGGNHAEVANWRRAAALEKTQRNRPDLLLR
jgi:tRNA (guanine37-N1)-methyltransferase